MIRRQGGFKKFKKFKKFEGVKRLKKFERVGELTRGCSGWEE
jgi:hypothetical protein